MTDLLKSYDSWLEDSGPAALVLREPLMPVEGTDGVIFPATAGGDSDRGELKLVPFVFGQVDGVALCSAIDGDNVAILSAREAEYVSLRSTVHDIVAAATD